MGVITLNPCALPADHAGETPAPPPLRPLLRFQNRETPFAQLQGTIDSESYVAAFRFNRYRAGYRQPSTSFVGWRTENAGAPLPPHPRVHAPCVFRFAPRAASSALPPAE